MVCEYAMSDLKLVRTRQRAAADKREDVGHS